MILRNCQWDNGPDDDPEKVPRKRVATAAQVAASRANGAKSKGAKSDATREKVKFNAVQHGAACKEIFFLDGEDPAAFWAKVDRIVAEERAEGELEIDAIKTLAYSRVTKERAINAQAIAVNERMEQIEEHFDDQKQVEVRDLIPCVATAPDVTVTKLMNSIRGCAFLIREFTSIDQRLLVNSTVEVSQREYALQLAGHRPDELLTDPVVRELNRSYLASNHGPGFFTVDMAANAFMFDRPPTVTETEYTRRMGPFIKDLVSVEEGWQQLRKFVRDHIARLQERMELMGYREERALKALIGAAQSDVSKEGEKRERYINQSDRTFHAAVRTLQALRQERRKYGDRCGEGVVPQGPFGEARDPESEIRNECPSCPESQGAGADPERPEMTPGQGEIDPRPGVIRAGNDQRPNEPETTQVVDLVVGNNPVPAAAAVIPVAESYYNEAAEVAFAEKYRKEFDYLREYDHLL